MKHFFTLLIFFISVGCFAQTHLVISQVYGGGGNTGAIFKNDFIELFNPTSGPISLNGLSVQYASSTGTTWNNTTSLPDTLLQPGKYFLIKEASGGTEGVDLPSADATGTINLSAGKGKVILYNGTASQSGSCPSTGVIDKVGYGTGTDCFETAAAPGGTNTTSIWRNATNADTDNNGADFGTTSPVPRNIVFFPAPVTLSNFNIYRSDNYFAITWKVACLSTSVTFDIERSQDSRAFKSIYTSTETRARCASSFTIKDENPMSGNNFYRLKITDIDGGLSYSKIVLGNNNRNLSTIKMIPALVLSNTTLQIFAESAGRATLIIVDMQGRVVLKEKMSVTNGENKIAIDASGFSKGQYQVNVIVEGHETLQTRFVRQ